MNVIARLEYELAYYDFAVNRHYTTRTPPPLFWVYTTPQHLVLVDDIVIIRPYRVNWRKKFQSFLSSRQVAIQDERVQSALLFRLNWRGKSWVHSFTKGCVECKRPCRIWTRVALSRFNDGENYWMRYRTMTTNVAMSSFYDGKNYWMRCRTITTNFAMSSFYDGKNYWMRCKTMTSNVAMSSFYDAKNYWMRCKTMTTNVAMSSFYDGKNYWMRCRTMTTNVAMSSFYDGKNYWMRFRTMTTHFSSGCCSFFINYQ